jgi:hypothetical protein
MTAGQRLLIQRTLRVLAWISLGWLLILVVTTAWARWDANQAREYDLNPPTSREQAMSTIGETGQALLLTDQALFFWGPLVVGVAAYWARRFLILGPGTEGEKEKQEAEN